MVVDLGPVFGAEPKASPTLVKRCRPPCVFSCRFFVSALRRVSSLVSHPFFLFFFSTQSGEFSSRAGGSASLYANLFISSFSNFCARVRDATPIHRSIPDIVGVPSIACVLAGSFDARVVPAGSREISIANPRNDVSRRAVNRIGRNLREIVNSQQILLAISISVAHAETSEGLSLKREIREFFSSDF